MTLNANSLASAIGARVINTSFKAGSTNLSHLIGVIATYDPLITSVIDEEPRMVTSPEDAANWSGYGFPIHRLVKAIWKGGKGVPVVVIPQAEADGAVQASGHIAFTGSAITKSGTLYHYVGDDPVLVALAKDDDDAAVATKVVAAINANHDLPVTAAINGTTDSQVDYTAKPGGTWGNAIALGFNRGFQEFFPQGMTAATAVVTAMSGGSGVPDIEDALAALGIADTNSANELGITELSHGYLQDSTTLDAISAYNGEGNDTVGCWDPLVYRPFRSLVGDTASDLSTLLALAANRILDRTTGVVIVDGSPSHPAEIAAQALGHMARINNDRAAQSYKGVILSGVIPGKVADRWSSVYDSRDQLVKAGCSPTDVQGNAVILQNVCTFYHPTSISVESNAYRSQRNISILQNIVYNWGGNFKQDKWAGISIVADVAKVTNVIDRQKVRDISAVMDDCIALFQAFEKQGWIYSADYSIEQLKAANAIQIRAGGMGFDIAAKFVLSGEGQILDSYIYVDTSLAVILG